MATTKTKKSKRSKDSGSAGIRVIARAADILGALSKHTDGLTLGEIAQQVELPRSTVQRIVQALDEANIHRFTKVLHDFLVSTQFIIVTHSKKTMTCASTIYGVTMQESGISKQVSVRFEDVSDDGRIRPERLAEAAKEETQAA